MNGNEERPESSNRHAGDKNPGPRTIRVVRVFGVLDIGGAELRTIELMPRLVEAGIEPHFVTLSGRPGVLAQRVRDGGAYVHPLGLTPGFPARFVHLLRRLRPQVVHSDVATFSGAILHLAAIAGVPVRIAHFRSDGDGHRDTVRRRMQRYAMRRLIRAFATDIVGVAPGALSHGFAPSWPSDPRCRVIPNGFDLDRLRDGSDLDLREMVRADPDDIVCVHVGRPSAAKRRWLIPPIVAEAKASGLTVRAVLVGPLDPEDDARVRGSAATHGVAGQVHLFGPTDRIGALLRQADVAILPSAREGLPGAVLEAAAVGTPVVASDLPGTRFAASRLAGITLVSPEAPARTWLEAVRQATSRPTTKDDREAALAAFERSDFHLNAAAAAHIAMYRQESRREY